MTLAEIVNQLVFNKIAKMGATEMMGRNFWNNFFWVAQAPKAVFIVSTHVKQLRKCVSNRVKSSSMISP